MIDLARSKINAFQLLIVTGVEVFVLSLTGLSVGTIYLFFVVLLALYLLPAYQTMCVQVGLMRDAWPLYINYSRFFDS
ncbi:MAG: hypothetical protein R2733_24505 [Acidimicrobiales bacterium]